MKRKKWSEVRGRFSPEVLEGAAELLTSLRLRGLREARGLTQAQVADRLQIRQVSVSKLESRKDVRLSTLAAVVEAMGGEVEIYARFPDAVYRVAVGEELEADPVDTREHAGSASRPS